MNTLLIPPPERDRPGDHARRRSELVAIVAATKPARARRAVTPMLAAASIVAVTAGVTLGVPALRDLEPAGSPSVPKPPSDSAGGSTGPLTTPKSNASAAVRDLTYQQRVSFWESCRGEFGSRGPTEQFANYRPISGLTFLGEDRIGVPASWLVARDGDQYFVCIKDGRGNLIGNSGFGPRSVKDIPYLFKPIDQRGQGTGQYTAPVVRVTVQPRGGAETEAALRHGFWFIPIEEKGQPPRVAWPMAGRFSGSTDAPANHTIRGYDTSGKLVYDSSRSESEVPDCYTDPDGREVIINSGVVQNPSPQTCTRTLHWRP